MIKFLRKHKYLSGVVFLILLILGISMLRITQVEVTGNNKYTSEELTAMIFPDTIERNSVYCYLKDKFRGHRQIPFVEDYKLVFRSFTRVEMIVYEKSVVGYVSYMGNYLYFDKDGIVVESSDTKLDDIPQITGLDFGHIVLHQPLPVEDQSIFEEILNLTQILSVYEVPADKILYDSYHQATLYIGEVQVILGDRQHMNGKIAELSNMLPKISGLAGVLDLQMYDESNNSIIYTFKRK